MDDSIEVYGEAIESPTAAALIAALNEELLGRYPEAGATHFRLDAEEVAASRGAFVVARLQGMAVGCGAIRRIADDTAEIKRMYVDPQVRRRGVAVAILDALEAEAKRLGVRRLVLETGVRQPEALSLYEKHGFSRMLAFGEYIGSPLSVCMEKSLANARTLHFDTRVLQAGYPPKDQAGPILPGPQFCATYVTPGEPSEHALLYGRFQNPTWSAWESAVSELEGGTAIAFASGMAAIVAVFATVLRPGEVLVLPSDSYYTTRTLAQTWLAPLGIELRFAPTEGDALGSSLAGARLLWVETPSNPKLDVSDIAALVAAARVHGTLVAVDNTTATVGLQQPLGLGATFSVASDTKALTGHSDLLLGHVATTSTTWVERLRTWRTQGGAIPGPMETWLAHRAMGTLGLRLDRQCDNAEAIAEVLQNHPAVIATHYPGLRGSPAHAIAQRQMTRGGCVVSFDLGSKDRAQRFLRALRLVREATSFGGIHSTAERRARWGGDVVPEGFIRFSCGIEATADLVADVTTALHLAIHALETTR